MKTQSVASNYEAEFKITGPRPRRDKLLLRGASETHLIKCLQLYTQTHESSRIVKRKENPPVYR
jgi:hypothetical protein